MPAHLIKAPNGYMVVYSYMMAHEAKDAISRRLAELGAGTDNGRSHWWRCTNDKNEHKRVSDIVSRNHRDGYCEGGLSVSTHTGYQSWGYKYIYPVTGDYIGRGSDGEPLLTNVVALGCPKATPHKKYVDLDKALDRKPITYSDFESITDYVCSFGNLPANAEVIIGGCY